MVTIIPFGWHYTRHTFIHVPMGLGIPPLNIKIMLESNPQNSRILVWRLAVASPLVHDINLYISTNNHVQYLIKHRYRYTAF